MQNASLITIDAKEPIKRNLVILRCLSFDTNLVFGITAEENDATDIERIMIDGFKTEYFSGLLNSIKVDVRCINGVSYLRILDERVHGMMKSKYEELVKQGCYLKAELLKWDYMRFFGIENLRGRTWKSL
jgi:hypothetical protein